MSSSSRPEITKATFIAESKLVQRRLRELDEGWSGALTPRPSSDLTALDSTFDAFPLLFVGAFPPLALAAVRPLSLAVRLLSTSLILADKVLDLDCDPRQVTETVLRVQAMQLEAHRAFSVAFPADSAFWPRYRSRMAEYGAAVLRERRFVNGELSWPALTEAVAKEIALDKNRPFLVPLEGLAVLTGSEPTYEALAASVDAYAVAHQLHDDLCDWRGDLGAGFPTLVLTRALPTRPTAEEVAEPGFAEGVARAIYYGGHARHTLDLGLAELAEADRCIEDHGDLPWRRSIALLRQRMTALRADLERIAADSLRRAG